MRTSTAGKEKTGSPRSSRSYRLIGKSRSIWQIPVSVTQGSDDGSTLAGTYLGSQALGSGCLTPTL